MALSSFEAENPGHLGEDAPARGNRIRPRRWAVRSHELEGGIMIRSEAETTEKGVLLRQP